VLAAAQGKAVVALGPGLGQEPETAAAIRRIVLAAEPPLVLDADGVNAFAGRAGDLKSRKAPTVLTPHPGELGRLLGISTSEVQADRLAAARRAAKETGAVVVLKGSRTLIAEADGDVCDVWINPTGNPGMATGGTGDVLSGIIGGLIAQGSDPYAAAVTGVYIHAAAGRRLARRLGDSGLLASDLLLEIPLVMNVLRQGGL